MPYFFLLNKVFVRLNFIVEKSCDHPSHKNLHIFNLNVFLDIEKTLLQVLSWIEKPI